MPSTHNRSHQKTACHLAWLAAALLLAACSGDSAVTEGNRTGILYIGNGTEPQTIDPHNLSGTPEARIADTLFEGLVNVNPHTLENSTGGGGALGV